MITYTPMTPLEAAILESGRFELATDTAGREVLCVGHRRLPKIVLQQKAEGLHDLMEAVGASGGRAFEVTVGDPWEIDEAEPDDSPTPLAAEEHLVMGLRPMMSDGRPVRVAASRDVIRLFLLPWVMPAKTVTFGGKPHYVVTGSRGVVGDWDLSADGSVGVVVGLPEVWVGILERHHAEGSALSFRCDVPVPWVGDSGVSNAIPTMIGVYESHDLSSSNGYGPGPDSESWIATLPVVMTEGTVVSPAHVPDEVDIAAVSDGPWELEWQNPSDFSMESLN